VIREDNFGCVRLMRGGVVMVANGWLMEVIRRVLIFVIKMMESRVYGGKLMGR
jgi:hypothetical protein